MTTNNDAEERGNARYAARQAKIAARRQRMSAIAQGHIVVAKPCYDWAIK